MIPDRGGYTLFQNLPPPPWGVTHDHLKFFDTDPVWEFGTGKHKCVGGTSETVDICLMMIYAIDNASITKTQWRSVTSIVRCAIITMSGIRAYGLSFWWRHLYVVLLL